MIFEMVTVVEFRGLGEPLRSLEICGLHPDSRQLPWQLAAMQL